MIKKICPRCNKLYEHASKCPNGCYDMTKKEGQQVYDKIQRKNGDFYGSMDWVRLTKLCKIRFKGLDIYQLYKYGRYTNGELSHHIIPVNDNINKALSLENLIYLCHESHNEIHTAYNRSEEDKRVMQEYLFNLIIRFKKEYM